MLRSMVQAINKKEEIHRKLTRLRAMRKDINSKIRAAKKEWSDILNEIGQIARRAASNA